MNGIEYTAEVTLESTYGEYFAQFDLVVRISHGKIP